MSTLQEYEYHSPRQERQKLLREQEKARGFVSTVANQATRNLSAELLVVEHIGHKGHPHQNRKQEPRKVQSASSVASMDT